MPASGTEPAALVERLRAAGCVFAEEEAGLLLGEYPDPDVCEAAVVRRLAGEPLEQVLGWADFGGLRVRLRPGVFVPRQRSLLLVDLVVDHLRGRLGPVRVLDLGCGSGALGALIADRLPGAEVWAADIDPDAVAAARLNLPPERVCEGDLFDALPPGLRFDAIVANLPYVPREAIGLMPPEAREHEHRVALDGGTDGLDLQRRAIAAVTAWLRRGGLVVVESARRQAPLSASLLGSAGLYPYIHHEPGLDAVAVTGLA